MPPRNYFGASVVLTETNHVEPIETEIKRLRMTRLVILEDSNRPVFFQDLKRLPGDNGP